MNRKQKERAEKEKLREEEEATKASKQDNSGMHCNLAFTIHWSTRIYTYIKAHFGLYS